MRRNRWPFADRISLRILLLAAPLTVAAFPGAAGPRIVLGPRFLPGQTLHYQIDSRDVVVGQTTAPIANPEGGSHSTQTIHMLLRLDVLPDAVGAPAATRIRVTCEKCSAESQGDALDLEAIDADERYNRMEGHSLDCIVQPDGQVAAVQGSDAVFANRSTAASLLSWLGRISYGSVPREGIALGEKWKSDRVLPGVPLSALTWHTDSTYLRDEPCKPDAALDATSKSNGAPARPPEDKCAVLLTRFQIFRRGSPSSDATPEDYRRNGLRTSGKWSGSGESTDSISLSRGVLVISTQISSQELDYRITSASTGSTIHHQGAIDSHSNIALVSDSADSVRAAR